ncbi:xanthine dehydrogenase family protein molybdopterin-binding subunit [Paraglaciecola psychrophila]|uniref:Aldehyde oxidase and xanthine dehydrogenase molybdopterin binding protein n=1 Tax=Paraglaciecola psychrophila 170 TaxID=1129794 RepID=K7AX31_9ALTE|nr:molybdopterin cofactor-binding domain-containing protein [Paraglaciecola psychrophila]AGH43583.1 aldehyde oxidase and xanthine dehydrogenase molybdopterin binding protein [Paraglaciecola psychrophila 170]GAC39690.1 membrane-bound aldehyde dehydrogenase [pyrroloquinoline-quinone] [Paraglaciecola psychrophila 170]
MSRLNKTETIEQSRRQFLIGTVGTGLVMAFAPVLTSCSSESAATAIIEKRFNPTVWFEIDQTGSILVNISRAEMGQHVGTAIARIVADELGADWNKVTIKHVDTDPKWGYMVTGGSWSVFQSYLPMSQAGAAGRTALIEAAATLLGVQATDCETQNSQVICGDKSISFADIVSKGKIDKTFSPEELAKFTPKDPKTRQLIAKPSKALDIPAKSTGTAKYGIDVELEGMVYARPLIPPTRYGSKVLKVNDSKATDVKGYLGYEILQDPSNILQGWVSVLADTYYGAISAAKAIEVEYQAGETANVSEQDLIDEGERLVADKSSGGLFVDLGDIDKTAAEAKKSIDGTYRTASALHFALEPVNAAVEFKDGICHVHTGNQWQSLFLPVVAKSVGLTDDKVIIHQYYLGGGFGRRLAGDYMIPAAVTAKAIGKPVKLVFTREDDSRFDCIRSPSVQHFAAYWDNEDALQGIDHAAAAGWPSLTMAPGFMPDSVDKKTKVDAFSISGADHWYSLNNHRVRAINNPLAQKTFVPGYLRAVGPGWIGWGVESFMDEIAHAQNMDPIDFRMQLLDAKGRNASKAPEAVGGAKRLAHVLNETKMKSGWGKTLPENEGMGVAIAAGQERAMPTWSACVAHVRVDPATGNVKVLKLTNVMDCGTVVHPDGALAQTEGAMLWGLSLALHEGTAIKDGQVADTNLNTYTPLRMADVPELDISFVQNTEFPTGLGEPGLIAVAPAIGNAIFNAVGARVRDLPITPKAVKALI